MYDVRNPRAQRHEVAEFERHRRHESNGHGQRAPAQRPDVCRTRPEPEEQRQRPSPPLVEEPAGRELVVVHVGKRGDQEQVQHVVERARREAPEAGPEGGHVDQSRQYHQGVRQLPTAAGGHGHVVGPRLFHAALLVVLRRAATVRHAPHRGRRRRPLDVVLVVLAPQHLAPRRADQADPRGQQYREQVARRHRQRVRVEATPT